MKTYKNKKIYQKTIKNKKKNRNRLLSNPKNKLLLRKKKNPKTQKTQKGGVIISGQNFTILGATLYALFNSVWSVISKFTRRAFVFEIKFSSGYLYDRNSNGETGGLNSLVCKLQYLSDTNMEYKYFNQLDNDSVDKQTITNNELFAEASQLKDLYYLSLKKRRFPICPCPVAVVVMKDKTNIKEFFQEKLESIEPSILENIQDNCIEPNNFDIGMILMENLQGYHSSFARYDVNLLLAQILNYFLLTNGNILLDPVKGNFMLNAQGDVMIIDLDSRFVINIHKMKTSNPENKKKL